MSGPTSNGSNSRQLVQSARAALASVEFSSLLSCLAIPRPSSWLRLPVSKKRTEILPPPSSGRADRPTTQPFVPLVFIGDSWLTPTLLCATWMETLLLTQRRFTPATRYSEQLWRLSEELMSPSLRWLSETWHLGLSPDWKQPLSGAAPSYILRMRYLWAPFECSDLSGLSLARGSGSSNLGAWRQESSLLAAESWRRFTLASYSELGTKLRRWLSPITRGSGLSSTASPWSRSTRAPEQGSPLEPPASTNWEISLPSRWILRLSATVGASPWLDSAMETSEDSEDGPDH